MSAFSKAVADAMGTLIVTVAGTVLLKVATIEASTLTAAKFWLSVISLAIGYAIFSIKVANAILIFKIERRSQQSK